jgi:serine/threonine-protein kinase
MAEVFRGVAESLQGFKKSVAIKRILPNLTKNKKFVSMFLDEARLSLHLQHANIVHVFDIGIADTAYFIVMEYVDGSNLKSVIEQAKKQGRRIKIAQTMYLMIEICKGLAYAHDVQDPETGKALGIVHRDISPPNILVSKMGEVKLVDFGLAKATSQIETTDPGVVKGKFSYLSPEAASGVEVDHRADVFAVGILAWEMFTGKRLFYGDTDYQTVELVRQAKIPSIQALNPEVEPELEAVIRKALARDPKDRFQHAADLGDALAQILFARGMKVTSRDIATLVKEVTSERDRAKKANGPAQQNLINTLILEEMAKFTSLDDLSAASSVPTDSRSPLSPETRSGGDPLDPGSFVDTRAWVDDLGSSNEDPVVIRDAPRPEPARQVSAVSPRPAPPPRPPGARPVSNNELDSLQQILEPDRTGATRKVPPGTSRHLRTLVVLVLLAALIGGGLYVFKDQLLGGNPTTAPANSK